MAKVACNNHKCIYNKQAYDEEIYSECTLDNLVFLNSCGKCEEVEYGKEDEDAD